MKNCVRFSLIAAIMGFFTLLSLAPDPAFAADDLALDNAAASRPHVDLKAWKASSHEEKLAFLYGITTFLQLEREWQSKQPLPINQSIVGSWVRGFEGVSLRDMVSTVDAYIARNPDMLDKSVLEILGRTYIRPKLTEAERRDAARRVYEILKTR